MNTETDIIGKALLDYQSGNYSENIITYSSVAGRDEMAIPLLFRTYDEMPEIEKRAMELCRGSILDVGCGSGSHALFLQNKGETRLAPSLFPTCPLTFNFLPRALFVTCFAMNIEIYGIRPNIPYNYTYTNS